MVPKGGKIIEIGAEYFYEMLQKIEQRSGLYFGSRSITRLRSFLDGYMAARQDLGIPITEQEQKFGKFQDWIRERFKITSTQGWERIILFHSLNERDAFDSFFKLWEQFCNGENASRITVDSRNPSSVN